MFPKEKFELYWKDWVKKELTNYKITKNSKGDTTRKYIKKGYLHFDDRYWFPDRIEELKNILESGLRVRNSKSKKVEWWSFSPFLKILIKTPRYKYQNESNEYDLESKIRPICFASHKDSLIYSFYSHALTQKYESYIDSIGVNNCAIAYRSNLDGKCNIQFSKEVFDEIKLRGNCTAIALDIKGYFDNIDHLKLKEKWVQVIQEKELPKDQYKIYKSLTQYSYVSKNSFLNKYDINLKKQKVQNLLDCLPPGKHFEKFNHLREAKLVVTNNKINKFGSIAGIPQGSGMSAVLSNIYLVDFDRDLFIKSQNENFFYRRYCDDILIVCNTDDTQALKKYAIEKVFNEYNLEIQDKKVEIIEFRPNSKNEIRGFNIKKQQLENIETTDIKNEKKYYKSLQYLGFEFNGKNIFIRSSSLSKYFRKMKGRITKTIVMAYSKKNGPDSIWQKHLLEKYTHFGKRNFLSYAYNASKDYYKNKDGVLKQGMNSPAIKKQLKRHISILQNTLKTTNIQRFQYKSALNKAKKLKRI